MRAFVITLAGAVGGAALAVAVILVMAQRGKKPTELNADVWDADSDIRAANLAAKTAAWKADESWMSPKELANRIMVSAK